MPLERIIYKVPKDTMQAVREFANPTQLPADSIEYVQ